MRFLLLLSGKQSVKYLIDHIDICLEAGDWIFDFQILEFGIWNFSGTQIKEIEIIFEIFYGLIKEKKLSFITHS